MQTAWETVHVSLQGVVSRCFTELLPICDAATQTELAAGTCRHRSCVVLKQKLKLDLANAAAESAKATQKPRTSDAKASREWRGMLHDSQEETADTVRRLREAQWVRSIRDTQITQLEGEVLKLHAELENSKKSVKEAERLSAEAEARVKTLEISARLAARASVRGARSQGREGDSRNRTHDGVDGAGDCCVGG